MIFVAPSLAVINSFLEAWGEASGHPFPHVTEAPGVIASKRDAWRNADTNQRVVLEAGGTYRGWTLRPTEAGAEPNGNRYYCEVPDDLLTIVQPMALTHFNRTLTPQHNAALLNAANNLVAVLPADWGTGQGGNIVNPGNGK